MKWTSRRVAIAAAVCVGGIVAAVAAGYAQTMGQPERFTALAVNMNRGGSGTVEIVVNRWSSQGDRNKLVSTALEKGPQKLLDVLEGMPRVGYIRTPDSIGWDLHFAFHAPLPDGGERVVLATNRPIGFWEASRQPRSIDYPFTVIEMHLNADGEGEGKMSVAAKIIVDPDNKIISLENYGTSPVLLQGVKRERQSR